jgi:hypothetical protein
MAIVACCLVLVLGKVSVNMVSEMLASLVLSEYTNFRL